MLAAALAWCGAVVAAGAAGWDRWLLAALTSRLSICCGLVLAASALALAAMLAVLWSAGAAQRARRTRSQDGAAILEFALALPIALMLVLIMIQASLLMGGNLCVHYSAYCATRSAIVQIPRYAGPDEPTNVMDSPEWSGKYLKIRSAAIWALLPISRGSIDLAEADDSGLIDGLRDLFGSYGSQPPAWVDERLARKLTYAERYTEMEVAPPAEPRSLGDPYGEDEDIRVQVRHTFYLSVPYAGRIFAALDGDDGVELGDGEYGTVISASCRLTNEGVHDTIEEEIIAPAF